MRNRRRWVVLVVLGLILTGGWFLSSYHPEAARPMPLYDEQSGLSENLPADLKLMWETQPLGGTPDSSHGPNPRASTDEAINAASRVFNTVELQGKTRGEVIALLGDPKSSNDSVYNFPFWPAPRGAMVYRFDCGAYGWQLNVIFGWRGKVTDVQRHWIH